MCGLNQQPPWRLGTARHGDRYPRHDALAVREFGLRTFTTVWGHGLSVTSSALTGLDLRATAAGALLANRLGTCRAVCWDSSVQVDLGARVLARTVELPSHSGEATQIELRLERQPVAIAERPVDVFGLYLPAKLCWPIAPSWTSADERTLHEPSTAFGVETQVAITRRTRVTFRGRATSGHRQEQSKDWFHSASVNWS